MEKSRVSSMIGSAPTERIDVAVLGATGTVGERIVRLLVEHPWFRLTEVGGSERSAGVALGEMIADDDGRALPPEIGDLEVRPLDHEWSAPLVLSALPSAVASEVETRLADAGHLVVSNASSHRMSRDVPLLVPELNPDHLGLLEVQSRSRSGGIVTNPNCAVVGLAVALAPLHRTFGLERVVVTSFQGISGAGRPGDPASALVDNVLPVIRGEEVKIASEPRKILGQLRGDSVTEGDFAVSATATRVPVLHGHLLSVSATFSRAAGPEEVAVAMDSFAGDITDVALPTAPERVLEIIPGEDRPQPRLDRDRGRGMTVTVGRIRPCEVGHVKFMALSHNLLRGAAGAAVLNAELCHARGFTRSYVGSAADATAGTTPVAQRAVST